MMTDIMTIKEAIDEWIERNMYEESLEPERNK